MYTMQHWLHNSGDVHCIVAWVYWATHGRLTLAHVGISLGPRTPLNSIEPRLTAVTVCSSSVVLTHTPRIYLYNTLPKHTIRYSSTVYKSISFNSVYCSYLVRG